MRLVRPPTIADRLAAPANGFGLIRLALALAVVVSHAWSVTTGRVADEPLFEVTRFTLGEHAVNGFFAISGFLVAMSFVARGPRDFALSRALRIVPGLVAATLVVAFGFGLALSQLDGPAYLASAATWRFVGATLTTLKSNLALPGVFAGNPLTFPMGTVWTLKYEVLCYLGLLAAGVVGILGRRDVAASVALALLLAALEAGIAWPAMPKGVETGLRLPLLFAIGAALFVWRERVPCSAGLALALLALAAVAGGTPLYRGLLFAGEAYAIVALALSPWLARPILEPRADLSYGTYLYGWPIQQTLRQLWPDASAATILGPSVVLTLLVAFASWRCVEAPALALKRRLLRPRPA